VHVKMVAGRVCAGVKTSRGAVQVAESPPIPKWCRKMQSDQKIPSPPGLQVWQAERTEKGEAQRQNSQCR